MLSHIRVSICICSQNRFPACKKLVRELSFQIIRNSLYDNFNIIVLENGSKIKQSKYYESLNHDLSFIQTVNLRFSGLSYARNVALDIADKDSIIFFLDDDIIIPENFVINLYNLIGSTDFDLIGGPVDPILPEKLPKWFKSEWVSRNHNEDGFGATRLSGGNFGLAPKIVRTGFRFNENLGMNGKKIRVGEEKDFVEKILAFMPGVQIYYSSQIRIFEKLERSKLGLWYRLKREFANGYASHSNSNHHVNTKFYGSILLAPLSVKIKAIRFVIDNFPKVYKHYAYEKSGLVFYTYVFSLSRCFGLLLRKIRWQI